MWQKVIRFTEKQPAPEEKRFEIAAAALNTMVTDFIAIAQHAHDYADRTGNATTLMMNPKLVPELLSSPLPPSANTREGRQLFIEAFAANLLLPFLHQHAMLANDTEGIVQESAPILCGRILGAHKFASEEPRLLKTVPIEVRELLKMEPSAKACAEQYRAILKGHSSATSTIRESDWGVLIADSITLSANMHNFLFVQLPQLTRWLHSLDRGRNTTVLPVVEEAHESLTSGVLMFLGFCEKYSRDPFFMRRLNFLSLSQKYYNASTTDGPRSIEDAFKSAQAEL